MRRSAPPHSVGGLLRRLPLAVVLAVGVWVVVKPFYNPALVWITQGVARLTEYPRATVITAEGSYAIIGRSDLRAGSGRLKYSLTQVHFNLVPFLALCFALGGVFKGGGWRRLGGALGVLAGSHVLTLFLQVKAFFAFNLGPWSAMHYSNFERNLIGGARYFFDIPVTFALPLVLWVAAYPDRVLAVVGLGPADDAAPSRR
jgi:hypothetical protein